MLLSEGQRRSEVERERALTPKLILQRLRSHRTTVKFVAQEMILGESGLRLTGEKSP
jgi:hypothetical protein